MKSAIIVARSVSYRPPPEHRPANDNKASLRQREKVLGDGRNCLMGDAFTLAKINLAPFIARLDGLRMLPVWLDERPLTRAWW